MSNEEQITLSKTQMALILQASHQLIVTNQNALSEYLNKLSQILEVELPAP